MKQGIGTADPGDELHGDPLLPDLPRGCSRSCGEGLFPLMGEVGSVPDPPALRAWPHTVGPGNILERRSPHKTEELRHVESSLPRHR